MRRMSVILIVLAALTGVPAEAKTLLVVGDSLSAGYGIPTEKGWVHLLQRELNGEHRVVNASISGETTGGALARLPKLLKTHQPDVVILELGGNDGLRGHPVPLIRRNLKKMIALSRKADAQVLLLGMRIPPNYGARYTRLFASAYREIAESEDVPLVPFFLDKVALEEGFMQDDDIHPTAKAQPQLVENVRPHLEPML